MEREGFSRAARLAEVWSAHSRDGGVSIIDVATKKVAQTINVGTKRSNRIKLTRDGKFALISDLDAGDLVVLDTAARKAIRRLPLGKQLEGILITPDGARAFVAVIDLKTWQVASRISAGAGPDGLAWVCLGK